MTRIPLKEIITIGILPSFIKKIVYCLKGYKIGSHVSFKFGSIISAENTCEIGSGTSFGYFSIVMCKELKVGKNTNIRSLTLVQANRVNFGDSVIISESSIIRAGHISSKSNITLEDRVHIFPHVIIDPSYPIYIGEETGIGFYSNIYTHGSYKNILEGYPVVYGPVHIGKRVELTYSVFVAPNTEIGDDAIVAYGSYVNKSISSGVLAAGMPAKIKRTKEQFISKPDGDEKVAIVKDILNNFIEYLEYSSEKYKINLIEQDRIWQIEKGRRKFRLLFVNSNKDYSTFAEKGVHCIIISMDKICKGIGMEFFDLQELRCNSEKTEIAKNLRRYFGRYGIRFA